MRAALLLSLAAMLFAAGCNRGDQAVRDYALMDVKLPNGKTIKCEVMPV